MKHKNNRILKNCLILFILPVVLSLFFSSITFATDNESSHITETALLGNLKDDDSACGVFTVVNFIVDIFSIGVGVLAIIGITIVGIKYLTAGGNEEQTRKAKHRMFQIVIGLVTYALLYVGTQWLLPGGKLDFSTRCELVSNEELDQIKAKEKAEREAERQRNEATAAMIDRNLNRSSSSSTTTSSTYRGASERGKRILDAAIKVAKKVNGFSYSHDSANFQDKRDVYRKRSINCASYASLVMAEAKLLSMKDGRIASDNYGQFTHKNLGRFWKYWKLINNPHGSNDKKNPNSKSVAYLVRHGKLVPGDICGSAKFHDHTFIYAGKKGNKYQFYEVSSTGTQTFDNIINNYHEPGYKVGQCIHAK